MVTMCGGDICGGDMVWRCVVAIYGGDMHMWWRYMICGDDLWWRYTIYCVVAICMVAIYGGDIHGGDVWHGDVW